MQRMDQIAASGNGWVNLTPGVHPDDLPPPPTGLSAIFGGNGSGVPLCTWTPGRLGRHGAEAGSVGVLHRSGIKAAALLVDRGTPLPAEWRIVQDHSRRGLVARIPADTSPSEVLTWLVEAGTALSSVPLTGYWQAAINSLD